MSTALAERPADGELIHDVSFALSAACASVQAALREARRRGLPTPLEFTETAAGVHATAPLDDVLAWQWLLWKPRIAAIDLEEGQVRITGWFDGQPWTLTSMQRRPTFRPTRRHLLDPTGGGVR